MALNGTFYGTTPNAYITPKIVWSATQSTTGNYSTVTATLYYSRTNSGYETSGIGTFGITINGTTKSETKNIKITYNSNTVAVTNSVKVPHNADGTKTITISGSGVITGTTLSSTTISANVTLDTIPRKSSLTASNGTLGTAQTLTISRASSGFTHSIRYKCGSVDAAIVTKTDKTSISFTPPLTLAAQNTTGTTVSITFTLYTFSGDTQIGTTTKTISCSMPKEVAPKCELTVSDAAGYVSTFFAYVQGQSQLAISVAAEEAHSSPITGYTVTADGKTYSAASVTTPVLSGSGELTVSATVKDKRGRSGTASMQIPVLAYAAPRITSLNVHRCDENGVENDQGEYVKATFSSAVERLMGRNTASYTLAYKKTADSSYTTIELTDYSNNYAVSGASRTFAADSGSSYDVQISVSDYFQTETRSTTASTARTLVHWNAAGDGIAFGKLSEKSDAFECAFEMFDRFGTEIGNGLAAYTGGGDAAIDPDTTLESLILTSHANAPQGLGTFYYISTTFYNTKDASAARSQLAHPYKTDGAIYFRYYASGAWSAWDRIAGKCVTISAEGEDFDAYKTEGWYYFKGHPTNPPSGVNGWLRVLAAPGTACIKQMWYRFGTPGTNDSQTWIRTYGSNTGWGSWSRVLTSADSTSAIAISTDDPDTTTEHLILTKTNTPLGGSYYMYIQTFFYGSSATTKNRAQIAIPYGNIGSVYHRYCSDGTWSDWRRHVNADELHESTLKLMNISSSITQASQTDYTLSWIYAYARGGVVDLHINATPAASATSWITVATLPAGYRPPTAIYRDMPYWNATAGAQNLRMRITTAGAVQLNRGQVGSSYAFHDTFVVA